MEGERGMIKKEYVEKDSKNVCEKRGCKEKE